MSANVQNAPEPLRISARDMIDRMNRGEAVYFVNAGNGRADTRTLHAGRSPAAGEKWIISQFVRDRPLL